MARGLHLADGLTFPLDAVTHTFGIFGQKGSGKSSTAAVFVEQGVHVGGRFVIADPTGVWWGLMHDGIGPGLPGIVFGGEHADVPLERTAGHVVAEFVVQQDAYPVVVLDMKLMRKADRTHFMLDFLETLYHDNREALHVVLDESWQFAPTQAREGGETIKLLGAVEDVVALGRARGLGITMISQRFATLNANVREQIGTLEVHRLVGSLDRKALKGWIEAQADPAREKEVMEVMAKLKTAQALVWSPAFLEFFGVVNVNAPQTFDSRATPKVGQRVKKPGKRAAVDLDTLRARMADTIEKARENDPTALKAKVRELERRLAQAPQEGRVVEKVVEVEVEKVVEVSVFTPEDLRWLEHVAKALEGIPEQLKPIDLKLGELRDSALSKRIVKPYVKVVANPQGAVKAKPITKPIDAANKFDERMNGDAPTLKAGARRMLDVIASFHPARMTRSQIATHSGIKRTGGTFSSYWSSLKTGGLIDENGEGTCLTEAGIDFVGGVPEPKTPEEVLNLWRGRLKAGARTMLDYVVSRYPNPVPRTELAAHAGIEVTGGTFSSYLSAIRQSQLIEDVDGGVRAADSLFMGVAR